MLDYDNELQSELLDNMNPDISSGKIIVSKEADQHYTEMISQHYPFSGSKIRWSDVPSHFQEEVDHAHFSQSIYRFFYRIAQATRLHKGDVVSVVGDGVLEVALTLPVSILEKYLVAIVEMPQHVYIVPEDVSWCACYTMEGNMDFGFSPITGF